MLERGFRVNVQCLPNCNRNNSEKVELQGLFFLLRRACSGPVYCRWEAITRNQFESLLSLWTIVSASVRNISLPDWCLDVWASLWSTPWFGPFGHLSLRQTWFFELTEIFAGMVFYRQWNVCFNNFGDFVQKMGFLELFSANRIICPKALIFRKLCPLRSNKRNSFRNFLDSWVQRFNLCWHMCNNCMYPLVYVSWSQYLVRPLRLKVVLPIAT